MKRGYRGSLVLVALALIGPIACTKPLGSFEQALSENATPEQLETYLKRHKGLRESDKQAKHPPLERSIEARKPKYVALLLKYGADPNQLSYSMTPLIRAMTQFLCRVGARLPW